MLLLAVHLVRRRLRRTSKKPEHARKQPDTPFVTSNDGRSSPRKTGARNSTQVRSTQQRPSRSAPAAHRKVSSVQSSWRPGPQKPFDSILVVDFETTGVKWPYHAVEVAWIELDQELNELDCRSSLIRPPIPIPREATTIHGISNSDVEDSPTLEQFVIEECSNPFETKHICFVAHNAVFDHRLFQQFCQSTTLLCTVTAARRVYPKAPNHKLDSLVLELGLSASTTHRALGDARACLELLRHLRKATGLDLSALVDYASPYRVQESLSFGKYKNQPIAAVPDHYLEWLHARLEADDPIAATVKSELRRRML